MAKTDQDLEAQLLEILNRPDLDKTISDATDAVIASGEGAPLNEEQRATLASLLEAGLPPPEEILRDAKVAEANDHIEQARQVDLLRRKVRRAKRTTGRK